MGGRMNLPAWWVEILNRPRPHLLAGEKDYSGVEEPCEVCRWLARRLWIRHRVMQEGRLVPVPVKILELSPATEDAEALDYGIRQIYACVRRLCRDGILLVLPAAQFGEVAYHVNEIRER